MGVLKCFFIIISLTIVTVVRSKQLTFHDFKVFSLKVETEEQLRVLRNLENDDVDGYSYWKETKLGRHADIVVPPNKLNDFNALVSGLNLNSTLKISNIQRSVTSYVIYSCVL